MWFVYMIHSKVSEFRYIGSTNNVWRRLREHNAGENQSTKGYRPFELEAYVAVPTERRARELEQYFKRGSGKVVLYKHILDLL